MLENTGVLEGITSLTTLFTTPNDLVQSLVLNWTDSVAGEGFGVYVSASNYVVNTPLPGGLLLMITALACLGAVGLRRHKAAAA